MNIDVDRIRLDVDEQTIERVIFFVDQSFVCFCDRMIQEIISYKTIVDEEELFAALRLRFEVFNLERIKPDTLPDLIPLGYINLFPTRA